MKNINKKKILKEIRSWTLLLFGTFFLVLLCNSKVFAKVQVEQRSMEDTLYSQQQLIIDKLSYNFKEPNRGDIIIFLINEEKGSFIDESIRTLKNMKYLFVKNEEREKDRMVKRVIGIAGDVVDIKDGSVYVNGIMLEELYAKGITETKEIKFPITVGVDQLFVLGDHRDMSKDSRTFGLVNCKQVEGKAIFRVYPFDKMGVIE